MSRSGAEVSSSARSDHGSARKRDELSGRFQHLLIAQEYLHHNFLWPHVLRFSRQRRHGKCARHVPGIGKQNGVIGRVEQNCQDRLGQGYGSGRIRETASSTDDLECPRTVDVQAGQIVMQFSDHVKYVRMRSAGARKLATLLLEKANEVDQSKSRRKWARLREV